jgi:phage-related minor tail protein
MADAMKEFQIRTIDGSESTKTAFSAIGLNADSMAQKFAAGGETAQGAFNETINALLGMQDPIAQNQAGVALFGTKFEDVGLKGISAFQGINVEAGNAKGAMDKITAEPLTAFFNSIKVGFNNAFGWIGAKLQEIDWEAIIGPIKWLATEAWTLIQPFVDGFKGFFEKVGENQVVSEILTAIASAVLILAAAFLVWQIATWGLAAATTVFSAVFSPIGLIILGIVAAIALIILIFKNWDAIMQWLGTKIQEFFVWITTKIGEFFRWIGDKIKETLTWIATKFGEFIKWLGEIPGKIVDFFKGLGGKIAEFFVAGGEKIKEFFTGIVDFFKSIPQKIADMFKGLGELIKNALRGAINLLPSIISTPLKNILGLGKALYTLEYQGSMLASKSNGYSTSTQNTDNSQNITINGGLGRSTHERERVYNNVRKRIK